MSLNSRLLALFLLALIAGCNNSGGTGGIEVGSSGGTDPGGGGLGGGTVVNTELVELDINNIRGTVEEVTQRLNMVTAEIYRTLKPFLYSADPVPADPILTQALEVLIPIDVDAVFAASNDGSNPVDPFVNFSCRITQADPTDDLEGIGGLEFRDIDTDDALSAGDQMVFSYNADGCDLMSESSYERAPNIVAGIIEFTFAAGSDVVAIPRRLVGTARFYNYKYDNGLLAHRDSDSDTVISGTIDFDIEFTSDTINRATFTDGNVAFAQGTSSLAGPLDLTFDLVERTLNVASGSFLEGNYNTTLDTVIFASAVSATRIEFHTIGYPDPAGADQTLFGDFDSYPQSGAIAIVGANNTAGLVPAQPAGQRITNALVETNGDGFFDLTDLFEPTSWDFYLGQFLVPGEVGFLLEDD